MPFVNNNGIKIYYIVEGKGPSIVMLHGGPGSHQEWYSYVNLLKDKYQLILLDLRGMGRVINLMIRNCIQVGNLLQISLPF